MIVTTMMMIMMMMIIGLFKHPTTRTATRTSKKKVGFISKTTTFLFPFLHDYDVKIPNFPFYGGRKQTTTKFNFSF